MIVKMSSTIPMLVWRRRPAAQLDRQVVVSVHDVLWRELRVEAGTGKPQRPFRSFQPAESPPGPSRSRPTCVHRDPQGRGCT